MYGSPFPPCKEKTKWKLRLEIYIYIYIYLSIYIYKFTVRTTTYNMITAQLRLEHLLSLNLIWFSFFFLSCNQVLHQTESHFLQLVTNIKQPHSLHFGWSVLTDIFISQVCFFVYFISVCRSWASLFAEAEPDIVQFCSNKKSLQLFFFHKLRSTCWTMQRL